MCFFQRHLYRLKKSERFLHSAVISKLVLFEEIISGISFRKFSRTSLAGTQMILLMKNEPTVNILKKMFRTAIVTFRSKI